MTDALNLLLIPILFSLFGVAWIQLSKQTDVPRSTWFSVLVVAKIFFVCALLIGILYGVFGISANLLLRCSPFAIPVILVASLEYPPGDSPGQMAVLLTLLFPIYITKQFVLGFPDRHKFMLNAPDRTPCDHQDSQLVGKTGEVLATLRPMGSVVIDGETYSAKSDGGNLIEAGEKISVCGVNADLLVVTKT